MMRDEDHSNQVTSPSALRRRLSVELTGAPQKEGGQKQRDKRRASTMTAAMGVGAIDPEVRKRLAPVVIIGLLYFKKPVSVTDLRSLLKERLLVIPRFLCHAVESEGKEVLLEQVPIAEVDMEYHVRELKQDKPMSSKQLDEYLSKVYNDPDEMDTAKPLWRFVTVPNMEDGRSLVIAIIDHTLVDGVAAVATLMAILDEDEKAGKEAAPPAKRQAGPPLSIARKSMACLGGVKLALLGPMLPSDPPNRIKEKDHRNPGKEKACGFGETVSLDSMKKIKSKFDGATVNDVMLATLTLTIQRYFAEVGEHSTKLRANFPINMRPAGQDILTESIGNRFSAGMIGFPLDVKDPVQLIWEIKKRIDMVKASPAPVISDKMLGCLVPLLVKSGKRNELVDAVLDSYGKVSCMLSNVPGPSQQVSFCKQPVDDIMFYAFAPLGVYFGILSYNGRVNVGIVANKELEPDASRIAKHWAPAFKEIEEAVAKVEKPKKPTDCSNAICFGGLACLGSLIAMKMGFLPVFAK